MSCMLERFRMLCDLKLQETIILLILKLLLGSYYQYLRFLQPVFLWLTGFVRSLAITYNMQLVEATSITPCRERRVLFFLSLRLAIETLLFTSTHSNLYFSSIRARQPIIHT
jgi:hypothetical protein